MHAVDLWYPISGCVSDEAWSLLCLALYDACIHVHVHCMMYMYMYTDHHTQVSLYAGSMLPAILVDKGHKYL